jgi:hypothetical protein
MTRWLWQLKWALVAAIFAGPALSYFSWKETQRMERVLASGQEYTAAVIGAEERRGRRGSRSYTLDVVWNDAAGAPHEEHIPISVDYADSIIQGDSIDLAEVHLRVSQQEPPSVIVEDAPNQLAGEQRVFWLGIIAGIAGLIISPIWFWLEARAKRTEDDIDETLARMRAGQTQPQP